MDSYATKKLEARIVDSVNALLVSGDIKNLLVSSFVTVTGIHLSKDNEYAKLFISCLDESNLSKNVKALQRASGYIQTRLGKILNTRKTPKLTFVEDRIQLNVQNINRLLESVK